MGVDSEVVRCASCGEPLSSGPHACPKIPEEKKGRLQGFDPNRLIPSILFEHTFVEGTPKILARVSDKYISFIIRDDAFVGPYDLDEFVYFREDHLANFPDMVVDEEMYYRPLVHGSLHELSSKVLFEAMLETNPELHGTGVGVALLEQIAKEAELLGYTYLCGYQNDAETASFFLKRGYVLLEELTEEARGELQVLRDFEDDPEVFYTVFILSPEDRVRMIRPERLHCTSEERIAYKEALLGDVEESGEGEPGG